MSAVSKRFGAVEALAIFRSRSRDGEFVVLLGPTGAGKTTTLRLIAGLERPDRARADRRPRRHARMPAQRDVAFVFQQYSLYPHLTVYDNLAFPLRSPLRRLPSESRRRVQQVAELLHIEHKLSNRATACPAARCSESRSAGRWCAIPRLSDGRAVVVARCQASRRTAAGAQAIQRELGATILYVTHDQIEAMTMADRIGVMNEGA